MSDEFILDDVIETFNDEDKLISNIRNNPFKWIVSLAIIVPGLAYTFSEEPSYASALQTWGLPSEYDWILAILVTGQIVIAPMSCYWFARTGNVMAGLFIAMGGSAILLSNPDEISDFSYAFGWSFFVLSVALTLPMLLVLKGKKKLLDPGKERVTWCTLLSTAILVYTLAVIVPASGVTIAEFSCESQAGELLSDFDFFAGSTDACTALTYRYAPVLGMVAAIGWAWPKGKHIIDDLSDDFLDGLKD